MSTIKGTPKDNKRVSLKFGKRGRVLEIQIDNFKNSKSLAMERRERKNKIREPRKRTSSHILETLQNITYTPKKHIQKHEHIKYHSFPQNPPHLTILQGNVQAKLLGLVFQIPRVLWQSTKFVRVGARILMVDSFSWRSFTYMYMFYNVYANLRNEELFKDICIV